MFYKTQNGINLLTTWGNGDEYEKNARTAYRAARILNNELEILHGKRERDAEYTFGLPYTSSSAFAAVWNTNTEARKHGTGTKNGDGLFFQGIAIDDKGRAVAYYLELKDGEEVGDQYEIIG